MSHPLGNSGATYDDHLRLVGKRVGDFLLVLIELFSLGRTAEALRTKMDRIGHPVFATCTHFQIGLTSHYDFAF